MAEQNGAMKLPPSLGWTIAVSLLLAGIAYGTLMAGQTTIARDMADVKIDVATVKVQLQERYYTAREIDNKLGIHETRLKTLEGKP